MTCLICRRSRQTAGRSSFHSIFRMLDVSKYLFWGHRDLASEEHILLFLSSIVASNIPITTEAKLAAHFRRCALVNISLFGPVVLSNKKVKIPEALLYLGFACESGKCSLYCCKAVVHQAPISLEPPLKSKCYSGILRDVAEGFNLTNAISSSGCR